MRSVRFQTALNHGVLYPQFIINIVLYLHRFRRKPAISKFDWLFTPKYKSSPPIATDVGSVLQKVFSFFQLAHTQITWFRVKYKEHLFAVKKFCKLLSLKSLNSGTLILQLKVHKFIFYFKVKDNISFGNSNDELSQPPPIGLSMLFILTR